MATARSCAGAGPLRWRKVNSVTKYAQARRRLDAALNSQRFRQGLPMQVWPDWLNDDGALHRLQVEHEISLEFDSGCCCAHMGGPARHWIWYSDHGGKELAVTYALIIALAIHLERENYEKQE